MGEQQGRRAEDEGRRRESGPSAAGARPSRGGEAGWAGVAARAGRAGSPLAPVAASSCVAASGLSVLLRVRSQLTPFPPSEPWMLPLPDPGVGCREGRCSLGCPETGAEAQSPSWKRKGCPSTRSLAVPVSSVVVWISDCFLMTLSPGLGLGGASG